MSIPRHKTFHPEEHYPAACNGCYYRAACQHRWNPASVKQCYTHRRDCEIWAGNNPTTGTPGNCTCGYTQMDKAFFNNIYADSLKSQPTLKQAVFTAELPNQPRKPRQPQHEDTSENQASCR